MPITQSVFKTSTKEHPQYFHLASYLVTLSKEVYTYLHVYPYRFKNSRVDHPQSTHSVIVLDSEVVKQN